MQTLCALVDGEKQNGIERINLDVKYLRGEREAKVLTSGKYTVANTLLILVDGENSGEVFRVPVDGYQGSTFKQLSIHEEMYTDYVLQVINLHRKTLRENKVGSAIPHLNKKLFKAINVPIPPYEEQKRIVSYNIKDCKCHKQNIHNPRYNNGESIDFQRYYPAFQKLAVNIVQFDIVL